MDEYLTLFCIADECDNEISDVLKNLETNALKVLVNQIKKDFKEKNFVFDDISNEEGLISIQIASQYFRLIGLIGLELLEREK